jgi:hypothetical protein
MNSQLISGKAFTAINIHWLFDPANGITAMNKAWGIKKLFPVSFVGTMSFLTWHVRCDENSYVFRGYRILKAYQSQIPLSQNDLL